MTIDGRHPFSDLSSNEFHRLIRAARAERDLAIREVFAALFRRRPRFRIWPARQRAAQVWPPKDVKALSLTEYL